MSRAVIPFELRLLGILLCEVREVHEVAVVVYLRVVVLALVLALVSHAEKRSQHMHF